ncbi:MAG: asparagine synthetase B [Vicinamibacterales bacterium]
MTGIRGVVGLADSTARLESSVRIGNRQVAACARLDNREEILGLLGLSGAGRGAHSDSALVQRAFDAWGEACVSRLLGDWCLAAWDEEARRLFVARDQHGISALYVAATPSQFAFSSDRQWVLAQTGVRRELDEQWLAHTLAAWPRHDGRRTCYIGLQRLPPAHALTLQHGNVRTWRYWRLEEAPDVRLRSRAEYAEALGEHLDRAVASRLRPGEPIALALSAGLDSTAVAALAARQLHARGERMLALTAIPAYPHPDPGGNRFGNEFALAARVAAAADIDHVGVDARDVTPLDGLAFMLEAHGEPTPAVSNYYWVRALHETARDHGARVVLTGQYGNMTASWPGLPTVASVFALGLGGWWPRAAREAAAVMRYRSMTVSRCIRQALSAPSPIHPRFADRMGLAAAARAWARESMIGSVRQRVRAERQWLIAPGADITGARRAELAAAIGVESRDPMRDIRLMEFVHGMPPDILRLPVPRAPIRDAMRGLLPDAVRLQTRRGLQAPDLIARVRAVAPLVEEQLAALERHPLALEYLDLPRMRQVFDRASRVEDERTRRAAATVLLRGLGVGVFLLRH